MRNAKGFSLLEVIMVVAVMLMIGAVATPAFIKMFLYHQYRETAETLDEMAKVAHEYYQNTGEKPATLDDLLPYYDGDSFKDAYGEDILMFKDVNYNGVRYSAIFLSMGRNRTTDSSCSGCVLVNGVPTGGTFEYSEDDIIKPVNLTEETPFSITIDRLNQADAALRVYVSANNGSYPPGCSSGSESCVVSLVREGYLDPKYAYDYWGSALVYKDSSSLFVSKGPDKTYDTADDIDN